MRTKKAVVSVDVTNADQNASSQEDIVNTDPQMIYELTIHCLACNYKTAKGGYNEPQEGLNKTEVLTLAQHNPRCKIDSNCECVASVSNEVEATNTTHITHFLIHLM